MRSSLTPIRLPRSLLALTLAIAAPASLLSGSLPFGTWDSWANPSDLALRPVAVESEVARPTTVRRLDRPSDTGVPEPQMGKTNLWELHPVDLGLERCVTTVRLKGDFSEHAGEHLAGVAWPPRI